MTNKKRVARPRSADEKARHAKIRKAAQQEFPPAKSPKLQPATSGVGAGIRRAREEQGLTWYAVAKLAEIPNPSTVRDIEYGRDAKLSNVEAIAKALGLTLSLAEAT